MYEVASPFSQVSYFWKPRRSLLFRLECNCSYSPPRFIFRYIAAFIAIDSTDSSPVFLFLPPPPLRPVSLILSPLKSSAVTARNAPPLHLYGAHIFIPLLSVYADLALQFDIFLPFSSISYSYPSPSLRLADPHSAFSLLVCTFLYIGILSLFNGIFAIDFQFAPRTLRVFARMTWIEIWISDLKHLISRYAHFTIG